MDATAGHSPGKAGDYVTYREEKQVAGERRGKPVHKRKFYLIDREGQELLVATGDDTGTGDGHYLYKGNFPGSLPVSCTSRRKLTDWINGLIADGVPAPQSSDDPAVPTGLTSQGSLAQTASGSMPQAAQAGLGRLEQPGLLPVQPSAGEPSPGILPAGGQMHSSSHVQFLAQMNQQGPPMFKTFKRDRFKGEDDLRRINYYLIGHDDKTQLLAVNAKEIKSSGGHYAYHAAPSFAPRVWKNGAEVRRWLASMCTHPDPVLTPAPAKARPSSAAASAWPMGNLHGNDADGGLIRDTERRRALVNSTLAAVQAKLDMLRRRAGVECTLTMVGLDDNVRVLTTAGVTAITSPGEDIAGAAVQGQAGAGLHSLNHSEAPRVQNIGHAAATVGTGPPKHGTTPVQQTSSAPTQQHAAGHFQSHSTQLQQLASMPTQQHTAAAVQVHSSEHMQPHISAPMKHHTVMHGHPVSQAHVPVSTAPVAVDGDHVLASPQIISHMAGGQQNASHMAGAGQLQQVAVSMPVTAV